MQLEKIDWIDGTIEELLPQAKHGERIFLGENWDAETLVFNPTKPRFYHSDQGTIFCNDTPILRNIHDEWGTCGDRILLIRSDEIVDAHSGEVLYRGNYQEWDEASAGRFLVKNEETLLLNGKNLAYTSPTPFDFGYHPLGFYVLKDGAIYLNGTEHIADEPSDGWWEFHQKGLIVYRNGGFYLNNVHLLYAEEGVEEWYAHQEGLVICKKSHIYLVVLKDFPQ
jgi:hypothetical protein